MIEELGYTGHIILQSSTIIAREHFLISRGDCDYSILAACKALRDIHTGDLQEQYLKIGRAYFDPDKFAEWLVDSKVAEPVDHVGIVELHVGDSNRCNLKLIRREVLSKRGE